MPLPQTPSKVLEILARLVEERTGLRYGTDDLPLFGERVSPRAFETGFESLLDYYYYLRYDPAGPAELDALIESLVVQETYLFRELGPLRALVEARIAPQIAAQGRARIWCAACATGEEPLTLAMVLAESRLIDRVEIVASDISARALERARQGQLSSRALRAAPPAEFARWVQSSPSGLDVRAELRAAIHWRRVNLIDPAAVAELGEFDAIVCRNVLIYFSDETTTRVVSSLAGALRPGGWILVGASESLMRFGTVVRCVERRGAFFYERAR